MYAQEMSGGEKKAELTGELQYRHGKSGAAGRRATHPQARAEPRVASSRAARAV